MAKKTMTPDEWKQCLRSNINRVLEAIIALECLHSMNDRRIACASNPLIPNAEASVIEKLEMEASNLGVPDNWRGILVSFSDTFKEYTGRRPHRYDDPQSPADKLDWWHEAFPAPSVDDILEGRARIA